MSNLQVPDPGLLCKLENFVLDNAEDHCLDVRIVCADGEFCWSSILLSAISPVMKSLLLPQTSSEAEQVLLLELTENPLKPSDLAWLPKIPVLLVNTSPL